MDWTLSELEKAEYIRLLSKELVTLRAKACIPQEELAKAVGISRQTYGAIERNDKEMSWNTYLALLFFFDKNHRTHQLLKQTGAFPDELITHINNGDSTSKTDLDEIAGFPMMEILEGLDEQGLHAVKTLLMVEYARCKKIPGDVVVKSFDGRTFQRKITNDDFEIANAVKKIKEKRKRRE